MYLLYYDVLNLILMQNMTFGKVAVLIVDDDDQLLESVTKCLNLHDKYDISVATSAKVAFDTLLNNRCDVIVCDIKMPVINGLDFLKKLRDEDNKIPFIVFTVTDDKQTVLKAFSLGANGFVGKYGKPETVFSTLERCIGEVVNASKKIETNILDVT